MTDIDSIAELLDSGQLTLLIAVGLYEVFIYSSVGHVARLDCTSCCHPCTDIGSRPQITISVLLLEFWPMAGIMIGTSYTTCTGARRDFFKGEEKNDREQNETPQAPSGVRN